MSAAEHTPGPWTFSTDPEGWSYYIHQADGAPYTPEYSDVAGVKIGNTVTGERKEIQEANARLIAAAPDLLEALEELVQRRKSVVEQTGRGTIEGSDNRYTKAVTAITKARGAA